MSYFSSVSMVKFYQQHLSIAALKEAKMEIYKVLSLLTLSKARFEDLLTWMKALKLEEGQQGMVF